MENCWYRYGLNLSTLEKTLHQLFPKDILFYGYNKFYFQLLNKHQYPFKLYISSRWPFFHNTLSAVLTWIKKDLFMH